MKMAYGDILREFYVPSEATGNGRGIACDGTYIYTTNTGVQREIFKMDLYGNYVSTIITQDNCYGLSYDEKENVLWAGSSGSWNLYKMDMNGNILQTINYQGIIPAPLLQQAQYPSGCGGITIDRSTDTIFFSCYLGQNVFNITKEGQYIGYFDAGMGRDIIGVSSDGQDIWLAFPHSHPVEVRRYSVAGEFLEAVNTIDYPDPTALITDIEYDNKTFSPKCVLWSIDATWNTPLIRAIEVKCGFNPGRQAVTDIIESVALEQTALAHILNAEGEKLQKILQISPLSNELLLKTNKSISSMINSITILEMVLAGKLALFENCICEPEDNNSGGRSSKAILQESFIELDNDPTKNNY